jgi:Protein of unknown function (DUF3768)
MLSVGRCREAGCSSPQASAHFLPYWPPRCSRECAPLPSLRPITIHDEHDFGSFELGNNKFFWKIEYYDKSMTYGSQDPADPELTTRVLTVMLAEDY